MVFQSMAPKQLNIRTQNSNNTDIYLTLFTRINSKWIIDLNVKCKTIKLPEDNIAENLDIIGSGDNIVDTIVEAQFMKEILGKLNFTEMKNFFVKDTVKRKRRQTTAGLKRCI